MINLTATPWAWIPILAAIVLSVIGLLVGLKRPSSPPAPAAVTVPKNFFAGPALTNSGAVSTVLSLLPLMISDDVRGDLRSASLLGAATLLFAFSTFLAIWVYSTVASKTDAHDVVHLKSRALIGLQSMVIWPIIVGAGCFLTFVLVTPLMAEKKQAHGPAPAAVTLKCDAKGCKIKP